jgi:hypothetical protein
MSAEPARQTCLRYWCPFDHRQHQARAGALFRAGVRAAEREGRADRAAGGVSADALPAGGRGDRAGESNA